jgi:hypothetical protein
MELIASSSSTAFLLSMQAGVYPEVLQSISGGLLRAELYLLTPDLAFPCAGFCVSKANFLLSPGVRKYCVGSNITAGRFAKGDLAIGFSLQEAYESHGGGSRTISGQARLVRSFGISAQGLLFKGRQNEIRCQRTDHEEIMQWWSQALPTRLHRGAGWPTKLAQRRQT